VTSIPVSKQGEEVSNAEAKPVGDAEEKAGGDVGTSEGAAGEKPEGVEGDKKEDGDNKEEDNDQKGDEEQEEEEEGEHDWADLLKDEGHMIFVGLKVYTQTKEPAAIIGHLSCEGGKKCICGTCNASG
jgi:hypothetical protein